MKQIIFEERGRLGIITLNRPEALHALSHDMIQAMLSQLLLWQDNDLIEAVLVRAIPGKAFCAGGDIRYVFQQRYNPNLFYLFRDEYQLNRCIYHYRKPYIALLNGITMGGGAGISIHGRYRIATEQMIFAMPETAIGFFPDIGAAYFLARLPERVGTYLGLTGARLGAIDCLSLGLATHYLNLDQLDVFTNELIALSEINDSRIEALLQTMISSPQSKVPLLIQRQAIQTCFNQNSIEEIITALQNQTDSWQQEIAIALLQKSPISLKVTLYALQQSETSTFDQVIQRDYQLARYFLMEHDFFEGIRALIIDKDQHPKWQPATLAEVNQSVIERYATHFTEPL